MKEIRDCQTLYGGFDEAAKVIQRLVAVLEDCVGQKGGLRKNTQFQYVHTETPTDRLARGEALHYRFTVQTPFFASMLESAAQALGNNGALVAKHLKQAQGQWHRNGSEGTGELTLTDVFTLWQQMRESRSLASDLTSLLFTAVLSTLYQLRASEDQGDWDLGLWQKGSCPVCGQRPHFGRLYSEQGVKQLECWLCGTQWQHIRLQCPFCDVSEHTDLGYFTVEDRSVCRVQFCRRCSQYYKIFDTREMGKEDIVLLIHHLASLDHDVVAEDEGFRPGSGLSWRAEV